MLKHAHQTRAYQISVQLLVSRVPSLLQTKVVTVRCLAFEGERSTNLVRRLLEVLGVDRRTNTESNASAEFDVVGEGSNTLVVDLGLSRTISIFSSHTRAFHTFAKELGSSLYLVATSIVTLEPALESQVPLAPASTSVLTLW